MKNLKLYGYSKCSTCIKAKNKLKSLNLDFDYIDITLNPPSVEVLSKILSLSSLDVNKLFNTSGIVYREQKIKEKLANMTLDEKLDLLSKNGKLIKRPILIGENLALVGYKEEEYNNI